LDVIAVMDKLRRKIVTSQSKLDENPAMVTLLSIMEADRSPQP
jgi:hypothetical protein